MNEIKRQVVLAKRRMLLGSFFRILGFALFAGLLLSAIGMAIPKIWHLKFLETAPQLDAWNYSWLLGGLFLALIVSAILTWRQLQSNVRIAAEIDDRFQLKERLSSALALSSIDQQSEAGQALLRDAAREAETIDVRDRFPVQPTTKALLPLIPLALIFVLLFIPNATGKSAAATEPEKVDREQIATLVKEFKKKSKKKREQLEALGLKDASAELKSLEKKFDQFLDDKDIDKKEALVKLNDIKQQIQKRQQKLGDSKQLKENLNKLKNATSGPAKELASAIADGDMQQAKQAIEKLAEKLKEGKLSEIEKKKLAKDLQAMADEIKKLADKHQQQQEELKKQIQQAVEDGDLDKAAQMQQKLEQNQQQQQQMDNMQKMAENLRHCAKCMNPGGNDPNGQPQAQPGDQAQAMQDAAESLEDLSRQIQQMQQQLEEMEALEDLQRMAGDCKKCINGQPMPGGQPQPNDGPPQWQDWAQGAGNGGGKRERAEEDTGGFKARVKGDVGEGETVITGTADGKNITGRSLSEARDLIQASMSQDADPLENQKLPKAQREHAQQYFEALRKSE